MAKSSSPAPVDSPAARPPPARQAVPAPATAPAAESIALVRTSSLPMLVQRELERMILAGDLDVGAKLN